MASFGGWKCKTLPLVDDGLIDVSTGQNLPSSASKYTKFSCVGIIAIDFVTSAYSSNYGYVFLDSNSNVLVGKKTEASGRTRVFVPTNAVQFRTCWKAFDADRVCCHVHKERYYFRFP